MLVQRLVRRVVGRVVQRLVKESAVSAVLACVVVALSGCSAAASATDSPSPATGHPSATSHSAEAALSFTVAGFHPVAPNGSQDTHAQTPGIRCDSATFAADETLGVRVADGFTLAGLPTSADLLKHFLKGTGTEVDYRAASLISKKTLASTAFRTVNNEIQEVILGQLKGGRTRVQLSAAQLPTVAFESRSSDLYWGFRGTQGLTVTGSGNRENGRFIGTLSYVIRDSYGFPADDTLDGFGPPMRYLQTACGPPQHAGGARWFPDTITVTVPFNRPT
jgi:hypothetical protein